MTEAEIIDRINSTIKKNGNRTITGDEMNFILKAIIEFIAESGGSKPLNSVLADGNETLEYDIILTELDRIVVGANRAGLSKGTFNTGRGGDKGVSLQCAVEFELNWQAGYLRVITPGGDGTPLLLQTDSEIVYTEFVPTTPTYGRSLVDKNYADTKFPNPTGTTDQYIKGDGTLGTFPTIPSITGLVPYTGATADVNLGTFHLDAAKGTFTHSGSTDTLTATHSSGSGIGLLITKGGSNEGLKVNKTSGSGNAATIIGTLEATTLVKTGGTSTQFLMADGSTSLGGGITVGTTAVTSGTDGRVFFQAGGVVQQDSAFFWDNTNKRLGVGATPASTVRLDVRAQGALSTDIAFRVRNSADTANLVTVQGNGNILFNNTTNGLLFNSQTVGNNQLELYSFGSASVIVNPYVSRFAFTGATTVKGVVIGNSSTAPVALLDVWDFAGPGPGTTVARFGSQHNNTGADNLNILFSTRYSGFTASTAHLARLNVGQTGSGAGSNARSYFKFELIRNNTLAERASITSQSNLLLQTPTEDTNDIGVIYIPNGTAPTGSFTDGYKQYSADITAGNAAPHFRTENGAIVKVYQETTGVGASTLVTGVGTPLTDTDTFDGYTLKQIVKALRNQGLLA
jgi:hypothetical protein